MAADHKILNTDSMEQLTRQLYQLSEELESCAASLAAIVPDKAAGGEVELSSFFCRLQCIDSSVAGDEVQPLLARMSTLVREEADFANHLGHQIQRAAELVADTEHQMANTWLLAGTTAPLSQQSNPFAAVHAASTFSSDVQRNVKLADMDLLAQDGSQAATALGSGVALMLDGTVIGMMRQGAQGVTYALANSVIQPAARAIAAAQPVAGAPAAASSRFTMSMDNVGCAIGHTIARAQWAAADAAALTGASIPAVSSTASTVVMLAESCLYDLIDGV